MAISVNICNYLNNDNDHYDDIEHGLVDLYGIYEEEDTRITLFESCIEKAVESLRKNIRCPLSRPLLKKAFNIYTEYLDNHLKGLKNDPCLVTDDKTIEESGISSQYDKWQQLLYKVIIGIIRILRADFESSENKLEIDLVIYFYELVKVRPKI